MVVFQYDFVMVKIKLYKTVGSLALSTYTIVLI